VSWRDELRRVDFNGRSFIGASFRGVPFFVDVSERSGGRRVVMHSFPGREDPYAEDLGRKTRSFRVDGYVLGDDYLAQRDALLEALEGVEGPGELKHPYHGVRIAICSSLSVRESKSDGGMATFAIDFDEAPAQSIAPTVEVDPASSVAAAADVAIAAARAELTGSFSAAGLPSFALASAETAIRAAARSLEARLLPAVEAAQEAAELAGKIQLLTAEAASLARQPGDVFDAFRGAITGLVDTIEAIPSAIMTALIEAYGDDLGALATGSTSTRQREIANQVALTGALRRVLVVEAARLAPRASFATIEDATAVRDKAAALIQEQAALAADTSYPALVALRAEVLRAVPGSSVFSRVVTVSRRTPIPSLLLAYQLYGSVDREADVIARNQVSHPGAVAGDLKVLSDAS